MCVFFVPQDASFKKQCKYRELRKCPNVRKDTRSEPNEDFMMSARRVKQQLGHLSGLHSISVIKARKSDRHESCHLPNKETVLSKV